MFRIKLKTMNKLCAALLMRTLNNLINARTAADVSADSVIKKEDKNVRKIKNNSNPVV